MSPLVPKRLELKETTTMEGCITMTMSELNRFEVIKKTHEKQLKVMEAAEILGLSKRQTLRWSKRLKHEGPEGMISKKRGATGNHKLPNKLKKRALRFQIVLSARNQGKVTNQMRENDSEKSDTFYRSKSPTSHLWQAPFISALKNRVF